MSSWSVWQGNNYSTKRAAEVAKKRLLKYRSKEFEYETRIVKGSKEFPYRVEFRLRLK
jgi:hypothetical protein